MHHGSISKDLRFWVEDALHEGTIKAVVCTSSLDLGVDFRPVDTVIQIGGPKGVARFMQRAGRSGHQPGASSKIYFVPTHSLEIAESAALRDAMYAMALEERQPHVRSFDVLAQYLMTLAVADGFNQNEIFDEVISTFCFQSMDKAEWLQMLDFLCTGGNSLGAYEEFQKMERTGDFYFVSSRKVATRHRLSIGTIVSDVMMNIRFNTGGHIGSVEEWFVSRLNPGDVFWFAGRSLELVRIKGLNVFVKKSKSDKGIIPSWQGGRMPLSSQMSAMLRKKLADMAEGIINDAESDKLIPLIQLQQEVSIVPALTQFLIEKLQSKDGCHLFLYPFEGRLVHEGLASLIAWRIARYKPYSFSLAFNDYGFELLSDQEIPLTILSDADVFSLKNLEKDVQSSINAVELARRRFKEIASVSGMIFKGYPGKSVREKHLQSSSHLLFEVLSDYDPYNLLLRQAYDESLYFQLEITRLRAALERINSQKHVEISLEQASPFSFPIMVDRLREKMSTEQLEDRIRKMKLV
jgi:ATP-dependent Lhr-like helicase